MDTVIPELAPLDGVKVQAKGREWVVPSLTAGEVVRLHRDGLAERLGKVASRADVLVEQMAVVGMALRHNYPDLTDAAIEAFGPTEVDALYKAAWLATWGVPEVEAGETSPEAQSLAPSDEGSRTSSPT
jgi:hypothetical protein